jgi:hypothetical protein
MMKILREEEAKKPSTKVSTFNEETASTVATKRKTEPKALLRSLRGDLDWILLKALDKERERRYPNVSDLAADIRRHLSSEPVSASPPSDLYRLRKFVRKHRWQVAAAALLLFVTTAGIGISTALHLRSRDDRVRAAFQTERSRLQLALTDDSVGLLWDPLIAHYDELDRLGGSPLLAPTERALSAVQNLTTIVAATCGLLAGPCWMARERFASVANTVLAADAARADGNRLAAAKLALLSCRYGLDSNWSSTSRLATAAFGGSTWATEEPRLLRDLEDCADRLPSLRSEWLLSQHRLSMALDEVEQSVRALEREHGRNVAPVLLDARLQAARVRARIEGVSLIVSRLDELCSTATAVTEIDLFRPLSDRAKAVRRLCIARAAAADPRSAAAARAVGELELGAAIACLPGEQGCRRELAIQAARAFEEVEKLGGSESMAARRLRAELAVASCRYKLDGDWERTERLLKALALDPDRLPYELSDLNELGACALLVPVLRSRWFLANGNLAEAARYAQTAVDTTARLVPGSHEVGPPALFQLARCHVRAGQKAEAEQLFRLACAELAALNGPLDPEARACNEEARAFGVKL